MLYAFDLLELDGEDLRALPLGDRKKRLARLVGKRRIGIVISEHTDEDGAAIFLQACKLGLEGIVSKRLSAPYRSGRSRDWIRGQAPFWSLFARRD
jgi:bifunctional non-homologous end joining protein LigD